MLQFMALSRQKKYKELLKRLNNRWFSPHNNIYNEGKLFDIGLAFNLDLKDIDIINDVDNKPWLMFNKAYLRLFILRNVYLQDIGNDKSYFRMINGDETIFSYKDYEKVYRYTLLTPVIRKDNPTIEPVTHWGECRTLKESRNLINLILDHSINNNCKAYTVAEMQEAYRGQ